MTDSARVEGLLRALRGLRDATNRYIAWARGENPPSDSPWLELCAAIDVADNALVEPLSEPASDALQQVEAHRLKRMGLAPSLSQGAPEGLNVPSPLVVENIRDILTAADREWLKKEPDDQDAGDYRGFVARFLTERIGVRIVAAPPASQGAPEGITMVSETQREAVARCLWDEFGDGDVAWDEATPTDRAGMERCAEYAITAFLGAAVSRGPAPEGPWFCSEDEHGETRRGWNLRKFGGGDGVPLETLWLPIPGFTEAEALAVRDALNRVAASPAGGSAGPTIDEIAHRRSHLDDNLG